MKRKRALLVTCVLVCWAASVSGQGLPKSKRPEDVGFSSERLARINKFFQGEIDKKAIPGATLLVTREGKLVYFQAIGYQDREKCIPMKPDAIFRIASMTKPITSVAVMMLAEEGKIDLLAPVSQYLPEFKDVKVGVEKMDPSMGKPTLSFEDPQHPMTVPDLLRHTSGLVYGPFGTSLVHQAYNKADLFDGNQTLAEFVTKLSKLPLAHQPGTVWEYGMSTDVLGRIVEVVSGMPFDRFVEDRVTNPLGMHDTAFYLSAVQAPRVAEPLPRARPAGFEHHAAPPGVGRGIVKRPAGRQDRHPLLRDQLVGLAGVGLDHHHPAVARIPRERDDVALQLRHRGQPRPPHGGAGKLVSGEIVAGEHPLADRIVGHREHRPAGEPLRLE